MRGTGGRSAENHSAGFEPAFRDPQTREVRLSRYADGRPAPYHLLDGLPDEWISHRDDQGRVLSTKPGIESGFVRAGRFYTREQAARFLRRH
jgi:hypothetical protein